MSIWRGWVVVDRAGSYRFKVRADEGGYLKIGDRVTRKKNYRVALERGIHAIEIGFHQTRGDYRLQTQWVPPDGKLGLVPRELLHARRPVGLYRVLRSLLSPLSRPLRQMFGVLLILAGFLLVRSGLGWSVLRPGGQSLVPDAGRERVRFATYVGLLVVLFVLTWVWTSRFTAPLFGGDDVRYIFKSLFPAKAAWFFNRFVHVYLLRAFGWLRDGDAFLGARTYWSFLFSVTVTAVAVSCAALGPRLQLRTTAVVLFLLIGSSSLLGLAGGAFADYSTMMFVTLALAVYLHGLKNEQSRGHAGWHEVMIGFLTVAACKSKATGVILGWLPLLFVWTESRFDFRNFIRKMSYWVAGAVVGLLALMSLDAWFLGDFFYVFKPDLGTMKKLHISHEPQIWDAFSGWARLLWLPASSEPQYARGFLWLLALLAPLIGWWKRQRIELRILFLIPLAYLLFLVAVYAQAPHVVSMRHLYPVIPLCCIAVGAILYWLGLEEVPWKQLLAPTVLLPFGVGAAVLGFVINPMRLGWLDPESSVNGGLVWLGWLALLVAISLLLKRQSRPALIVLVVLLVFGPSFMHVRQSLARRIVAQRGELILYPWETFRGEIEAARPKTIAVAPELWSVYGMVGKAATRQTIARAFFHRPEIMMEQVRDFVPRQDVALTAPRTFRTWRRLAPGLEEATIFDRSGTVALVRPSEIAE